MDAPFIKAIRFRNFKALRDTTLPLSRFTLLVGPNGSGKSTALEALRVGCTKLTPTAGVAVSSESPVAIEFIWGGQYEGWLTTKKRVPGSGEWISRRGDKCAGEGAEPTKTLEWARVYSLNAVRAAQPVTLSPGVELDSDGAQLAAVLDRLRDEAPERFEAMNEELGRWIPEFDRILFDTPQQGNRAIKLRTRERHHAIPASDVSQGTLLALAILTLAYLPKPPPIVGLEEPDRGLHPRLLRDVRDAMYRLAYPENYGEKRDPVQVIATTHSPYLLDLFRDHPEEIVIANKVEGNVTFTRLCDLPNVNEILADAALGEVWYSGILGGVPADR